MGRASGCNKDVFSQLKDVARPVGGGASEPEVRCAVNGDERRLRAGDRGGRDSDSHWHGVVWRAHAAGGAAKPGTGAGLMLRAVPEGVTLAVRAQPGAKRTAIAGIYGEGMAAQLKIAVQAQPLEGRANEAVSAVLAEVFGLQKNTVELKSGEMSRSKVFLLRGLTLARARAVLAQRMVL